MSTINKTDETKAVQVIAEVEVDDSAKDIISVNIENEQNLVLGKQAVEVIAEEKREEIQAMIDYSISERNKSNVELRKLEKEYSSMRNKELESVNKDMKKKGIELAKKINSFVKTAKASVFRGAKFEKVETFVVKTHTNINSDSAGKTVFECVVEIENKDNSYHDIDLCRVVSRGSAKLEALRKKTNDRGELTNNIERQIFELRQKLQKVDSYEKKLRVELSRNSLQNSRNGGDIYKSLKKVAFAEKMPKLLTAGIK